MAKNETTEIQNRIQKLGESFGFISEIEKRIHGRDNYTPIYDAVWYLDLEKQYNLAGIGELFKCAPEIFKRIKRLPFAGFEIEGSNTTSKNQLGNFANLYSGNFLYNFVIVNNNGAKGETDTYRRGVKLKRYFSENAGDKNVFFFDRHHLEQSMPENNLSMCNALSYNSDNLKERGTYGGETDASISIYEKIRPLLNNSGLTIEQNYQPWIYDVKSKIIKEASEGIDPNFGSFYIGNSFYKDPLDTTIARAKTKAESLYIPKLDICMGFNAPKSFTAWLASLADVIGYNEVAHFPILYALQNRKRCKNAKDMGKLIQDLFVPLIGIEIEAGLNKHSNGGIFNLAKNVYAGVIVTDKSAPSHVDFYKKELGIKNVTTYCTEE